ncbi:hypothetical protein AAY81_01685 [Denitrobacterium detoxificans]|uniref:AAA domain-containing protein n=1 Tax=Denitrobacterium detoxificans TaxID=79604 RepID=A0A172RWH8_9ACTN|nr:AAA family ATPase [Denitrobacterium detoxificans]ANE22078.1 hypothetical protein AAY81_01685 [Denitrobacterium detoxificans]SEO89478.1 AAA domain-containing protein [Denitrobacterium detoxificans]
MTNRLGTHYLKRVIMDAYGAFARREVGSFVPGLNVVFGPNESGKTTLASAIGGVLFGWPDARTERNTYRPAHSERAVTLEFAEDGGPDVVRCTRVRNAEGIKPDPHPSIICDIDVETYGTIFSLDSDELRSLGHVGDVTSRLLTAGAGTASSPAGAVRALNASLSDYFSRAAAKGNSIANIQARLDEVRAQVNEAQAQAARYRREDGEMAELAKRRVELQRAVVRLNQEIESITAQREALLHAQDESERLSADLAALDEQMSQLEAEEAELEARRGERYLRLDAVEERTLRESLDDMAEERNRLEHGVALAKQDYALSVAGHEALEEADDVKRLQERATRQKRLQVALSAVLPILFAVAGTYVFVRGRHISSLSITVLGVALVFSAVIMALAAIVMLFRPNRMEEDVEARLRDSQLVMQKDKRKLQVSEEALSEHNRRVDEFLAEAGMQRARGSLRRARALLDETGELRAQATLLDQRRQSIESQRASIQKALDRCSSDSQNAFSALGQEGSAPLSVIDERLRLRTEQRDAQLRTMESVNARYGELSATLGQARHAKAFDEAKLAQNMLRTRMQDALEDYARLLLARRMLEEAIASWEGDSQPAVYRQASELFSLMTDGAWSQVRISREGALEAVRANGEPCAIEVLSLGTCQQLYLSLRIALLMTARNVGVNVPIVADDILVNFDASRRKGAARALALLATRRQVIVLTCHREVVRLMQDVASDAHVVELSYIMGDCA